MQELNAIKRKVFDSKLTVREILLGISPEPSIRAAMAELLGQKNDLEARIDTPESRDKLNAQFAQLKFSPFLIDPVPGTAPSWAPERFFTWYNKRFADPLPELAHYELIICEDEFSIGFRPHIPSDLVHTRYPGHHGLVMGNLFSRREPEKDSVTTAEDKVQRLFVRNLLVLKLIDFLNKKTGVFEKNKALIKIPGCNELNELVNAYRQASVDERRQLLIASYTNAIGAKSHTVGFRTSGYGMGVESAGLSKNRAVFRYDGIKPTIQSIDDLPYKTLEDERSLLSLGQVSKEFSRILDKDQVEQITLIFNLVSTLLVKSDSKSKSASRARESFTNVKTKASFMENLSQVMDTITQNYLNSNDMLTEEQHADFFIGINGIFQLIEQSKNESAEAQELEVLFKAKLVHALKSHDEQIAVEFASLSASISAFNASTYDVKALLQAYFSALPPSMTEGETDPRMIAAYTQVKLGLQQQGVTTVEQLKEAIQLQVNQQGLDDAQKQLISQQFCIGQQFTALMSMDAIVIPQNLKNLESCCNKMDRFARMLPPAGHLLQLDREPHVDEQKGEHHPVPAESSRVDELHRWRLDVISLAGQMLHAKQTSFNFHQRPELVSESFYQRIKDKALELGAASMDSLQAIDEKNSATQERITQLTAAVAEQTLVIEQLNQLGEALLKSVDEFDSLYPSDGQVFAAALGVVVESNHHQVAAINGLNHQWNIFFNLVEESAAHVSLVQQKLAEIVVDDGLTDTQLAKKEAIIAAKQHLNEQMGEQLVGIERVRQASEPLVGRLQAHVAAYSGMKKTFLAPHLHAQENTLAELNIRLTRLLSRETDDIAIEITRLNNVVDMSTIDLFESVRSLNAQHMQHMEEGEAFERDLVQFEINQNLVKDLMDVNPMVVVVSEDEVQQLAALTREFDIVQHDCERLTQELFKHDTALRDSESALNEIMEANEREANLLAVEAKEKLNALTQKYLLYLMDASGSNKDEKIKIVESLRLALNHPRKTADVCVHDFKQCLTAQHLDVLSQHRDTTAQLFIYNVLKVLAVIFTACIYLLATRDKATFFGSKGENYTQDVTAAMKFLPVDPVDLAPALLLNSA